jgi:hypothetical protein
MPNQTKERLKFYQISLENLIERRKRVEQEPSQTFFSKKLKDLRLASIDSQITAILDSISDLAESP